MGNQFETISLVDNRIFFITSSFGFVKWFSSAKWWIMDVNMSSSPYVVKLMRLLSSSQWM